MSTRVLVIDAPGHSDSSLAPELQRLGLAARPVAASRNEILAHLERERPDAVVLDLRGREVLSPVEVFLRELAGGGPGDLPTLDQLERRYIQRVLQELGGNKSAAARTLGIDRRTLYRKLARFEARDLSQVA